MNNDLISPMPLNIDLAFHAPPEEILNESKDYRARELMTKCSYWERHLLLWIEFIRSDLMLFCPESVRKTTTVSMGLQFTGDLTISQLNADFQENLQGIEVVQMFRREFINGRNFNKTHKILVTTFRAFYFPPHTIPKKRWKSESDK